MAVFGPGRLTEWVTSGVLLGIALTLALPGNSLSGSAYRALRHIGADEALVAVPLALLAALRIGCLVVNGAWRRSPLLRMIGAVAGATAFGVLSATFALPWLSGSETYLSTAATTHLVLALADGAAAYRSAADVRLARLAR